MYTQSSSPAATKLRATSSFGRVARRRAIAAAAPATPERRRVGRPYPFAADSLAAAVHRTGPFEHLLAVRLTLAARAERSARIGAWLNAAYRAIGQGIHRVVDRVRLRRIARPTDLALREPDVRTWTDGGPARGEILAAAAGRLPQTARPHAARVSAVPQFSTH